MPTHSDLPIAVIADDFTGAAEIAGIGLRFGLKSEVQTSFDSATDAQLIVIDSDTRSGSRGNAASTASEIAHRLNTLNLRLVYKKTDSALRGHVAVEIGAIADVFGKDRSVLVPANPGMGRRIKDGLYFINGDLLHKTDFARDPEFPATTSDVCELLGASGGLDVQSISQPLPIPPDTLVIGDVTSTEDLAGWASNLTENCLPAGGSEFFTTILETLGYRKQLNPPDEERYSGPSLFVSGSMSDYSREVVEKARMNGMPVFNVLHENSPAAFDAFLPSIAKAIETHGAAMLTVADDTPIASGDSREIQGQVAEAVESILGRQQINSLYLTGGATAAAVLQRLGWKRFAAEAEIRQGVCRMSVAGQKNRNIVVKPGSYPWPDSFVRKFFRD